jgi:conjugal transfer pilus assembly protein TraU
MVGGVAVAATTVSTTNNPISKAICPSDNIFNELVGGVCWSAMFPVRIAGVTMFGGTSGVPSNADSQVACACGGNLSKLQLPTVGITLGFWQPSMLVEDVPTPFCFPDLGGIILGSGTSQISADGGGLFAGALGGNVASTPAIGETEAGSYNVHVLTFPLINMMQLSSIPSCNVGFAGMDVYLMSEVFPTWNNDILSMLVSPEVFLFANPADALLSALECSLETIGDQPLDTNYWTAGCWGELYPLTGSVQNGDDPIRTSSLDTARMIAMGFRLGWLRRTTGSAVVCGPKRTFVIPKDQFRMQLIYPNNETNNPFGSCTNWIGQSPMTWGEWDSQPGTGANFVYLIWQWTNCCLGVVGSPT